MVNRTKFTLGQAATEVGRSKAALSKAIADGRLSASRNAKGWYQIDAAELFRVYKAVNLNSEPENVPILEVTQRLLKKEVEERRNERATLNATIEDLRRRLDAESETVKRLTLMLEHRSGSEAPTDVPVKSWLSRLFK